MMQEIGLALGTAQFGMAYGLAGHAGAIPVNEVRTILDYAWRSGIRVLDTAPAYGNIEEVLGVAAGDHEFSIVSKIPAVPAAQGPAEVAAFVRESISRSRSRLGSRLGTLLFHRGADLLGPTGTAAWEAAAGEAAMAGTRLGVSCYSPAEAISARAKFPLQVAQFPGNAFDQRISMNGAHAGLDGVEIHLRSVFLQGLLLLPQESAAAHVPTAMQPLAAWTRWRNERGIDAVRAALGVAKSLPGVRYCVVGVERQSQLEEIVSAWASIGPLEARSLAIADANVIDPRRWARGQ